MSDMQRQLSDLRGCFVLNGILPVSQFAGMKGNPVDMI